jgi:hypothetical protein
MMIHLTITATENLMLEHDVVTSQLVDIIIELQIDSNEGWFELYDVETAGEDYEAEGTLTFDNKVLTGYTGIFSLPLCLIKQLRLLGYSVNNN